MNRYFLYLCFDGSRYHGWQIQPNGITVQEEIEKGLSVLLRSKTEIVGAGRTDAGVHAHIMTAHFDTENEIDESALCYKLNRFLPQDISIKKIEKVDNDLHARFSATSRTYHYYVHTGKDPFVRAYSWATGYSLDFTQMILYHKRSMLDRDRRGEMVFPYYGKSFFEKYGSLYCWNFD